MIRNLTPVLRGLFVKLASTFFLVCAASMAVVSWLDVHFSSARFERDARLLTRRLAAEPLLASADAAVVGDPRRCREFAADLFRRVIELGTSSVADFDSMLGYFYGGRLRVEVVAGAQAACASEVAAAPLLGAAFARAAQPEARPTFLRDGGEWALVETIGLPAAPGARVLVGLQFWPSWGTHSVIAYDLVRTLVFIGVLGISFTVAVVWFVLRRVRRATRAADRWAAGDLSVRIVDRSGDEFAALAERFNRMADALARTIEIEKALAVSVERNRIARDLHDTAKQRSFVLGLKLTELEHEAVAHRELATTVAEARRLADHLQQDLIQAVSGFRSPAIADAGPRAAFERSLGDLLSGSAVDWSLELAPDAERLLRSRAAIAQELLAITQEAVANARRHSGCRRIRIAGAAGERFAWSVEDDGRGFEPERAAYGMGLTNLRWRAQSLPAGRFEVVSSPRGTRVLVSFAVAHEAGT